MSEHKMKRRWLPLFLILSYAIFAGLSFQFFHGYISDLFGATPSSQHLVYTLNALYVCMTITLISLLSLWLMHLLNSYEKAIRESEVRFRGIVEATPDMIWECNLQFEFTFVSEMSGRLLGCPPHECMGKTPFDFMPEEARIWHATHYSSCVQEGKPIRAHEVVYQHADNRLTIAEVNARPRFNKHGEIIGYLGIDRDITERKQAERVFERTNDFYRILFDNFPMPIWRTNTGGHVSYLNTAAVEKLALPFQEPGHFDEVIHPEDRPRYAQEYEMAQSYDCQLTTNLRLRMKNGRYIPVTFIGAPCWGADSAFIGYIGYFQESHARTAESSELPLFFS